MREMGGGDPFGILQILLLIPITWIALSNYVKRWHDMGQSGWMTLTLFIPLIGLGILFMLGVLPGTKGPNKYGDDPRHPQTPPRADPPPVPPEAHEIGQCSLRPQSRAATSAKPSAGVKMFKRAADGTFHGQKGDVSDVHALLSAAQIPYMSVMAAGRTNEITARHEREIQQAVDLLTKVIDLYVMRGEPYAHRADMYFILAQMNRDRSSLDRADSDYRKALEVGASDTSNHSIWRNSISQIDTVRRML